MLTLLLYRHAKSDWSRGIPDKQRTLNKRGRKAAASMGAHIADTGKVPPKILCSTSERTKETLHITTTNWDEKPEIVLLDDLYHAAHWTILELIQKHGGDADPLMVLAHNPGLQDAGIEFSKSATDPDHLARLEHKLPTAALITLQFDAASWSGITERSATLINFVRPRQLKQ